MEIMGSQVQPPPVSRKYQPPSHILLILFVVPPPSRIEIPHRLVVIASEALSEYLAQGRLNRLKSELKIWAQCLDDAKHKKVVAITTISLHKEAEAEELNALNLRYFLHLIFGKQTAMRVGGNTTF